MESALEKLARLLYSLITVMLLPVLALYLVWRGLKQPEYLHHWGERFAGMPQASAHQRWVRMAAARPQRVVVWVHAVSVGETRASVPLIDAWLTQHPTHDIVLTHTTPTGRATGKTLFAQWLAPKNGEARMVQSYLPYDVPWAIARFFAWTKPSLGVLMETELWPNLLAHAHAQGIAMALVNARLSPKSAARFAQLAWLARPAVNKLSGIAAQTDADARRFKAWLAHDAHPTKDAVGGCQLTVTGNMKFDVHVAPQMIDLGRQWRAALDGRIVWLAASTRDDEEAELLAAWRARMEQGLLDRRHLLLIVPRHPQRFDRVAQLIKDAGCAMVRRSEFRDIGGAYVDVDVQVWLGDSLGEMFAYLYVADLVLIGASIPALGGQNPIEACVMGKPVFFGPHMFNFHRIAAELKSCEAGVEVASAAQWFDDGLALLARSDELARRSQAAKLFAGAHRGATAGTADFMASLLPASR